MLVLSLYQLPPSLTQPVKFPGWKMHTYVPADSLFDDPIKNLLSTLCSLTEILSSAHAKGGKSRNDFKLGTFTSRVPSDGAASMAVKELRAKTGLPVAYLILPLHMPALSCHWRRLQVQYGSTHGCVFRTFKGWFLIESKTDRGRGSERSCRINT